SCHRGFSLCPPLPPDRSPASADRAGQPHGDPLFDADAYHRGPDVPRRISRAGYSDGCGGRRCSDWRLEPRSTGRAQGLRPEHWLGFHRLRLEHDRVFFHAAILAGRTVPGACGLRDDDANGGIKHPGPVDDSQFPQGTGNGCVLDDVHGYGPDRRAARGHPGRLARRHENRRPGRRLLSGGRSGVPQPPADNPGRGPPPDSGAGADHHQSSPRSRTLPPGNGDNMSATSDRSIAELRSEAGAVASPPSPEDTRLFQEVRHEIGKVIVGQHSTVERLLTALLADGHVLLEGVPGLAKTLAVRTLATTITGIFHRIQFTPDLLPSDLIG